MCGYSISGYAAPEVYKCVSVEALLAANSTDFNLFIASTEACCPANHCCLRIPDACHLGKSTRAAMLRI